MIRYWLVAIYCVPMIHCMKSGERFVVSIKAGMCTLWIKAYQALTFMAADLLYVSIDERRERLT